MTYAVDSVLSSGSVLRSAAIDSEAADVDVEHCLNRLARAADDADARQIVRELLSVAADRIGLLCGSTLRRHYPRLAKGPLNLQPDELLSAVVERLIKAMRNVRPTHVREFFALAMRHIRWELNELARELDAHRYEPLAPDAIVQEPEESAEQFSPQARRILEAINGLSQTDREIFNLVRLGGMTHADAADVLRISVKTVQRRLNRILPHLWAKLGELEPAQGAERQRDRPLRMTVFAAAGKSRTFDYQAGDAGVVPFAMGHYVENTGVEPLRFLEVFKSSYFADISLNQRMALVPPELVKAHLELDRRTMNNHAIEHALLRDSASDKSFFSGVRDGAQNGAHWAKTAQKRKDSRRRKSLSLRK